MSATKPLCQADFAHLIPHAGNMILINSVDCWGDKHITCRSSSHQNPDHPLRLNNRLSAIHLLEYGAQSMAIHGGLLSGKSSPGFLAATRNVHFYIDELDSIQGDILISAQADLKIANGAVYDFSICDTQQRLLLNARATVIYI